MAFCAFLAIIGGCDMKIIIYGEKQDEKELMDMLLQTRLASKSMQYLFYDRYGDFLNAIKTEPTDLFIVTADGEKGRNAVIAAFKHRPDVARMWFPAEKEYVMESYEFGCTWFAPKPFAQKPLTQAVERYLEPQKGWWP